jgi:hypothetical protein
MPIANPVVPPAPIAAVVAPTPAQKQSRQKENVKAQTVNGVEATREGQALERNKSNSERRQGGGGLDLSV